MPRKLGRARLGPRTPIAYSIGRAIRLSDANLCIARLDLPAPALGAAWSQMTELEQALDDPAAIND